MKHAVAEKRFIEVEQIDLQVEPPVPVAITAPKFKGLRLELTGTSPYGQCRFSEKAQNQMREKMAQGEQGKKNKKREKRDYDKEFEAALHRSKEGWCGIPAAAFRNAAISACRIVGFAMTKAKLSIFIQHDGLDARDGTPLVKIQGTPVPWPDKVRLQKGGADIRVRARWDEWSCTPLVKFDSDQFSESDIVNLFRRIGMQVGIGEGRPDSPHSPGLGFGLFDVSVPKNGDSR